MATQESRTPSRPPFIAVVFYYGTYLLIFGMIGLTLFLTWPGIVTTFQARINGTPIEATPPAGAVGNQAPPSVRGTNPAPAPAIPTPIPGIAQSEAEGVKAYQATAQASQGAIPSPAPAPLPQNSAGQPVIDQVQQAQEQQALGLAEQEGAAAADQQLAAGRATANAVNLSRAPDVSAAEVATMTGRDPCHVPHANPATCDKGLYKPTPVNVP